MELKPIESDEGVYHAIFTKLRADGWPLCPRCGEDGIVPQSVSVIDAGGEKPIFTATFKKECSKCGWPIEPPEDAGQTNREYWLNGWCRQGGSVLMGTAYYCAGCGKFLGLGCVAFDDEPLPEKIPDFPFEEATCPLCDLRRTPEPPDQVDKLTERLERLRKRDEEAKHEQ